MGFPYEQCIEMLKVNNGDEMNTLNSLLSSSNINPAGTSATTTTGATVAPPKPVKQQPSSGLFNNWGSGSKK